MKHIHRYQRGKLGNNGYIIYKCNLPTCNHYISKDLVSGKLCLCNRCGDEMIMDREAMTLAKPHCKDCTISKKPKLGKLKNVIEELGI